MDISVKEAYRIVKEKNPELTIVRIMESQSFYSFSIGDKNGEPLIDSGAILVMKDGTYRGYVYFMDIPNEFPFSEHKFYDDMTEFESGDGL